MRSFTYLSSNADRSYEKSEEKTHYGAETPKQNESTNNGLGERFRTGSERWQKFKLFSCLARNCQPKKVREGWLQLKNKKTEISKIRLKGLRRACNLKKVRAPRRNRMENRSTAK
ncbi:unnamed protein product [Nesidiocoris tenuis]|uniref:Uncharacterized protein n=1 Tax=Nesidiocoris tenuis TaxID=355587 RepID=A0A6H5H4Y9_9HEMI|nr:unnamed protein product [Nesidiocoris tenuis]